MIAIDVSLRECLIKNSKLAGFKAKTAPMDQVCSKLLSIQAKDYPAYLIGLTFGGVSRDDA